MKYKNTRKRTIRKNGLRLNSSKSHLGNSRRKYAGNSFSRRAGIPATIVGQLIAGRKNSFESESANLSEGKVGRTSLHPVPKLPAQVRENHIRPEEAQIPKSVHGNGGGRWNNPRTSGIVAAVLLLAMLVTMALSSANTVKADDEANQSLNVYAEPSAQTATLKLAKEYVYAGSRMLAIEDYGISATPSPTPTP